MTIIYGSVIGIENFVSLFLLFGVYEMKEFNKSDYHGLVVDVHRNLNLSKKYSEGHKGRAYYYWSVLYRGKLIGHTDDVTLNDVTFVVNENGRQRIIDRGQRGVCAFARGVLSTDTDDDCDYSHINSDGTMGRSYSDLNRCFREHVSFNPYKSDKFLVNDNPIEHADTASFKDNGCFV